MMPKCGSLTFRIGGGGGLAGSRTHTHYMGEEGPRWAKEQAQGQVGRAESRRPAYERWDSKSGLRNEVRARRRGG